MIIEWNPLSRAAVLACIIASAAFCVYAFFNTNGFLLLDYVNLPFHEFGHLFFGFFGNFPGMLGGTLMQLIIPITVAVHFFFRKDLAGVFFSIFWLGENLLNIAVYIADARSLALPLVGGGEHDWNSLLSSLDLLSYDHNIAAITRTLGWVIMLGSTFWFSCAGFSQKA